MVGLFKDRYNYESLTKLALKIQDVYDEFNVKAFLDSIFDKTWDSLEYKQRVMQISMNLGKYLPSDYELAIKIIDEVILNYDICLDGFVSFFPSFIELYGQDEKNWDISMEALARYTQYASAEFAVRSFIINNEERMMKQMAIWAKDKNEHVRRLASEGCRPKLPWGQALTSFQKDPTLIIEILEQLKDDSSLYVRKSVANNLNDISKTHPDLVIEITKRWYGKNKHTDWIVKHGCRTLLKKGNREVLAIFGFEDASCVNVENFLLESTIVPIGKNMIFSFDIETKKTMKVRMEYAVDYVKANGKRNRKIFQISEYVFKEDRRKHYIKKHPFSDNSIRKHYIGIHSVTLIVNGVEKATNTFEVISEK